MNNVTVTQVDREAAAYVIGAMYGNHSPGRGPILDGERDQDMLVQAFARHCTTALAASQERLRIAREAGRPFVSALQRFHHFDDPQQSGVGRHFNLYAMPSGGALRELIDGDDMLTIAHLEALATALAAIDGGPDAG